MNATTRSSEFRRAVERLDEALSLAAGNPLGVDASIQRFEFCVELAWKSLGDVLLATQGIVVASPKPALQEAFRVGLIDDEARWLSMLRDRNLSSHTYRQTLALEIFARLPDYLHVLKGLAQTLAP